MSTIIVDALSDNNISNQSDVNQRHIRKQWEKLAKHKARLVFLLKCRRQSLTPRFIMNRVSHLLEKYEKAPTQIKKQADALSHNLKQSILNMEISLCHTQIDVLLQTIFKDEEILHSNLGIKTSASIIEENEKLYKAELTTSNRNLDNKFKKLQQTQDHMEDVKFDDSFLKNLSGVEIPKDVETVLGLGPKFAITPKIPPIIDLASDVEFAIKTCIPKDEDKKKARGEALYSLTKFSRQNKKLNRIDKFLQTASSHARSFLKNNPEVMVSNSDKGGVVIISKKDDYKAKIRTLLEDLVAFTPLPKDPTTTVKNKVNNILDKLYKANIIADKLKKQLKSWNTIPPRLFGQLKFHKEGNPLRPIVSTINSAAYKMSRFLATILRKSFTPKYGIRNSHQFVRKMRNIQIKDGYILVSFDVINCFGTIPVDLALEIIERDFHLIEAHTPIGKEDFMAMLRICLKDANYFVYEGKYYRQNKGMFMGSSLAPILVERVVEDIIDRALKELDCTPDFWATYVDDHLTAVPKNLVKTLENKLNSIDPNVQFTTVEQSDEAQSIEFLDLTVFNRDGKMITKWFHKPIASNRLLNFHSKHPRNMIKNTAKSLIRRVLSLSHSSFHKENVDKIKVILGKNGFPAKIITQLVNEVFNSSHTSRRMKSYPFINDTTRLHNNISTCEPIANSTIINVSPPKIQTPATKERKRYAGLTYIPGITEKLSKQLKRVAPDLTIAPRPPSKVGQLFTDMKYKLPTDLQSFVVYKIPCKLCRNFYIGETIQNLCERCKQHQRDVNNREKKPHSTALVSHITRTKPPHEFDFEDKSILKKVRHRGMLKIHEVNQIIIYEDRAVNFKTDAEHVTPVFYNLIKREAKREIKRRHVHPPQHHHANIPQSAGE